MNKTGHNIGRAYENSLLVHKLFWAYLHKLSKTRQLIKIAYNLYEISLIIFLSIINLIKFDFKIYIYIYI